LTVTFTAYLTWYDLDGKANAGAKEIIAAVILSLLPGGGAAAVSVIILAEVMQYTMSTLEYLRNKWVKPLIARHRAQGRAEGRAEMYDELRKWLERREAAEQAGLPFHEPPPTPDKKD
jgi:Na+/proline symporter